MCKIKRQCDECGQEFIAKRADSYYCSTDCRKTFNNRRAMRGAVVYDLLMAMRYERDLAKKLQLTWTVVCRLAEMYRRQDDVEGRKRSWRRASIVMDELGTAINAREGRL